MDGFNIRLITAEKWINEWKISQNQIQLCSTERQKDGKYRIQSKKHIDYSENI